MSDRPTSKGTPSATSSPASADGPSLSGSPAGLTTAPCGPAAARANLSPRLALAAGITTRAPYGGPSGGSSKTATLQQCTESRLRQRLAGSGSPEYVLTWKHWDMPAGEPICALRASGRRTSGSDCSGWPTPSVRDHKGGYHGGRVRNGKLSTDTLDVTAQLAGYPTPTVTDSRRGTQYDPLAPNMTLNMAAVLIHGLEPSTSTAQTEKRGGLNPALSRWLMGYPVGWCQAAIRAHRAMPKTRRKREK